MEPTGVTIAGNGAAGAAAAGGEQELDVSRSLLGVVKQMKFPVADPSMADELKQAMVRVIDTSSELRRKIACFPFWDSWVLASSHMHHFASLADCPYMWVPAWAYPIVY